MTEHARPPSEPPEVLADIPARAALRLRDHIKGLEAEAGNARAETRRVRAALGFDVERLKLFAAGLRRDLAQAEAQRDLAQSELAAARAELSVVQADLLSAQESLMAHGSERPPDAGRRGWRRR
jgi:hypothetical protein